jgi:hypothetical protein
MLRATIVPVSGENDKNLIKFIASTVETIWDQMATKDDLARVESKLESKIENVELSLNTKMTVIRGDIEQVQLRLDSIDHALTARLGMVETDISRLRSVVYLLVKDKPEMLRLLGQPTHGESSSPG